MTRRFDPGEFVPITRLCEERIIPLGPRHAKLLAAKGELPAAKIRGEWHSSPDLVRTWMYKGLNKAARRLLA
jgi:hypothetical protein